jgi:hypothetical protein
MLSFGLIWVQQADAASPGDVVINEIRIDQPSTDNDEYFELAGDPNTTLDGLTYIVIGDGSGGSGVIEAVVDLTGQSITTDGYFVAAESTFSLGAADLTMSLNFENSDNVTHLLVEGFSGLEGDDLDTDDDFTLSPMPTPFVDVGDTLGDVTGVVGFSFGEYEVLFTEAIYPISGKLRKENTKLKGSKQKLTVASFNVLNLDPNDDDGDEDVANGRFGAIAAIIVDNLRRPDIIALQEVQDNNGSVISDVTSADVTL